jgi:hypothetical protein
MEDDLNFSGNQRQPQFLKEMEDDLNFSGKFPIKNNLQLNQSQPSLT